MYKRPTFRDAFAALLLGAFAFWPIAFAVAQQGGPPAITGSIGQATTTKGSHVVWGGGTLPTIANCGTNASVVVGSDSAGYFRSGTSPTTCTLTFGTAWALIPACIVAGEEATIGYTTTVSAITLYNPQDGVRYHWHCIGRPNGG